MVRFKFVLPAIILAGGLIIPATVSFGTPAYAKKEKKTCTYCHTKGKELNKVGECYKSQNHSLEGCEAK